MTLANLPLGKWFIVGNCKFFYLKTNIGTAVRIDEDGNFIMQYGVITFKRDENYDITSWISYLDEDTEVEEVNICTFAEIKKWSEHRPIQNPYTLKPFDMASIIVRVLALPDESSVLAERSYDFYMACKDSDSNPIMIDSKTGLVADNTMLFNNCPDYAPNSQLEVVGRVRLEWE